MTTEFEFKGPTALNKHMLKDLLQAPVIESVEEVSRDKWKKLGDSSVCRVDDYIYIRSDSYTTVDSIRYALIEKLYEDLTKEGVK